MLKRERSPLPSAATFSSNVISDTMLSTLCSMVSLGLRNAYVLCADRLPIEHMITTITANDITSLINLVSWLWRRHFERVSPRRQFIHVFPGLFRNHADMSCQRSEEHTSELQSLRHLVCRLL